MLDILVNDVLNDDNVHIDKNNMYIQCRVNYPNNNTLYSEKIYLDDNYDVKKVEVLDQDGNLKITLEVDSINYKPSFDDEYFLLESLIDEKDKDNDKVDKNSDSDDNNEVKENTTDKGSSVKESKNNIDDTNKEVKNDDTNNENENNSDNANNSNNNDESTSNILDDIIYPLYVPQNTHLSTEDTISTDNGNRAILTFAGDSPFVLVEEVSRSYDEMEIIPVNGEPLMMSDSIGALSSNSLYWSSNGVDYYLSSTSLDSGELMTIAEGLSGTSVIVSSEK